MAQRKKAYENGHPPREGDATDGTRTGAFSKQTPHDRPYGEIPPDDAQRADAHERAVGEQLAVGGT